MHSSPFQYLETEYRIHRFCPFTNELVLGALVSVKTTFVCEGHQLVFFSTGLPHIAQCFFGSPITYRHLLYPLNSLPGRRGLRPVCEQIKLSLVVKLGPPFGSGEYQSFPGAPCVILSHSLWVPEGIWFGHDHVAQSNRASAF